MRGPARCQKERWWERPPERIPYLKLDIYLFLWISSGTPKTKDPYSNPHARTRADPKRTVSGAAAEANSLNKTWFRINLMWVQEWLKNQNCDNRTHAHTRAVPKRRVLGAAAGANSLFKTWFLHVRFLRWPRGLGARRDFRLATGNTLTWRIIRG